MDAATVAFNRLRTSPQKALQVDKASRTINGVVVCQVGDIKDWRPWSLNSEFLEDLVAFASKQKEGILSNFGHNWDNLGKRLGRMNNFRVEGDQVLADLTIFKAADKSPGKENLGEYVMDMVAEDDKAIMNSIVFAHEYFYQLDGAGQEVKIWYFDEDSGSWISANPALGKAYPKFGELRSVDVVDEGAATDSMFSGSVMLDQFLTISNHELFPQLLEQHYKSMPQLTEFFSKKAKPGFIKQLKEWMTGDNPLEAELQTVQDALTALQSEHDTQAQALSTKVTELAAKDQSIADLNTQLAQSQARITELEAMAEDLTGDTSGSGGDEEKVPAFMLDPINQRVLNFYKPK